MRIISVIAVLLIAAFPAYAEVMVQGSFEGGVYTPFGHTNYRTDGSLVVADPTAPNGSYSLKFTYPAGLYGGQAPAIVGKTFSSRNEIWGQYYFKYSSNWRWNTITNKQVYVLTGSQGSADMNFTIMMNHYAAISSVATQHPADSSLNQTFRSYGWTVTKDVWHKVVFHAVMNTAGVYDGIFQMWIDDVLRTDQSNVLYRRAGQSTGFTNFQMTPVYGGGAEVIPAEQYLWFDDVIVQTTAFGGGGGDTTPPYTDTNSPAKNSTGWLAASRNVSYYNRDATNVTRSTIGMSIDGGTTMTCADNLVCTPAGATATSYLVTYTRPSDWADNTVYTIVATAQDVYSNTMSESWTFTTALAAPEALNITTSSPVDNGTVGVAYGYTLTAVGGQSPYTWDNTTVLPAGLSISPNTGVIFGTPTATFADNITVRVTDAAATVDTQALSITINAAAIPEYPTVEIGTVADTYLKSGGSTTQNFSTADSMLLYTWPADTITHKGLLKWDLSSVSGTVPTTATLRLYMTGYMGGGGDNTYAITVHRITGVNPTVSAASWSFYDGTNAWTGGADGGGTDTGVSEATASIDKTLKYYQVDVTAMVRDWLLDPSTNKGMLILPPSTAAADTNRQFASSENPTSAFRPVLFLSYVPVPTAPGISGVELTGGIIE